MPRFSLCVATAVLLATAGGTGAFAQGKANKSSKERSPSTKAAALATAASGAVTPVLWSQPVDVSKLDLLDGSGGSASTPHGIFTFEAEDLHGTNPKIIVKDSEGGKWTVKMGDEARPETVASRFVWATGYFTREDYFLAEIEVQGLPLHLRRGQNDIEAGGMIKNVRLERIPKGVTKVGEWKWKANPFVNTRELNGLRVLMAVMNNWDVKDENNSLYLEAAADGSLPREYYVVSDLGATFGTTGQSWSGHISKGNVHNYSKSSFIARSTPQAVSFQCPTLPPLFIMLRFPEEILERASMRAITRNIPAADAAWAGSLLAQLSPEQIRDAFRAAGYSPAVVEEFAQTLQARTAALTRLSDDHPPAATGDHR